MKALNLKLILLSFVTSLLVACGGSSEDIVAEEPKKTPTQTQPQPPVLVETNVQNITPVKEAVSQKVSGRVVRVNEIVQVGALNSTGEFRSPASNARFNSNVSASILAEDVDGIARVFVTFDARDTVLNLCQSNCGTQFSTVVVGLNPASLGLSAGQHNFELWLEDVNNNVQLVDSVPIVWDPPVIDGLVAEMNPQQASITVSWNAVSGTLRYNLYAANQPDVTPQNYTSLEGGVARLALSQTSVTLTDITSTENFFIVITGVDGSGESAFSEEIKLINNLATLAPKLKADELSVAEDDQAIIDLVENDEPFDENYEASIVSPPQNGTAQLDTAGSLIYTPTANFFGSDELIYQLENSEGLSAQAVVSIEVTPVNDPPIANDDVFLVDNGQTSLIVEAPGVISNDTELDGVNAKEELQAQVVNAPLAGTLILNSDGSFNYTASSNFAGYDEFTYQIVDGEGATDTATVKIQTPDVNGYPPIAVADSYTVNEDELLQINAEAGILSNDSDQDSESNQLQLEIAELPASGELTLRGDGSFTYNPNKDFVGADVFIYRLTDENNNSATAAVVINVITQNDAPVSFPDVYAVDTSGTFSVSAADGVLANDTDVENDALQVNLNSVTPPSSGQFSIETTGAFDYTPSSNFFGTDSFSYAATDGDKSGNVVTVQLQVPQVKFKVGNNVDIDIYHQGILPSGVTISSSMFSAQNGSVAVSGGVAIYTAAANFVGLDLIRVEYIANGVVNREYFYVEVIAANKPPEITNKTTSFSVVENDAATITTVTVTDPEKNLITYSLEGDDSARFQITPAGILSFSSPPNFEKPTDANQDNVYTFDVKVTDSGIPKMSSSLAFTVSVTNLNEGPKITSSAPNVIKEGSIYQYTPEVDDEDDANNGTDLTWSLTNAPDGMTISATGAVQWTPPSDVNLTVNFSLSVADGGEDGSKPYTENVSIAVTAVDDPPVVKNQAITVAKGQDFQFNLADFASDKESDPISFGSFSQQPQNGSVTELNGTITYKHNNNDAKSDSFSYFVKANGLSSKLPGEVTITIENLDTPPVVENQTISVSKGGNFQFNVTDFASDKELDLISFADFSQTPKNGSVSEANGIISYTHDNSDTQTDGFSYFVKANGQNSLTPGTVTVTIESANVPPSINSPTTLALNENIAASTVVYTASTAADPEGDAVTWSIASDPQNIFAINNSGQLTIANNTNLNYEVITSYIIKIQAQDSLGIADTHDITITINDLDEPPKIAANISIDVNENHATAASAGLTATAVDPEGDTYTVQLIDDNGVLTSCPVLFSLVEAPAGTFTLFVDDTINYESLVSDHSNFDEDSNSNSFTYTVKLKATQTSDSSLYTEQDLKIVINDVVENTELEMVQAFDDDGFAFFNPYADVSSNEYLVDAKLDRNNNTYALIKAKNSTNGDEFVVAKYKAGALDQSFGFNGIKHIFTYFQNDKNVEKFSNASSPSDVTPHKLIVHDKPGSAHDGKVYIVGAETTSGTTTPFVIRLDADGNLDKTFAVDGKFNNSTLTNVQGIDLLIHSNDNLYFAMNTLSAGSSAFYVEGINADTGASLGAYGTYDFSAGYDTFGQTLLENSIGDLVSIGYIDNSGNFDVYGARLSATIADVAVSVIVNSAVFDVKDISVNSSFSKDVVTGAVKVDPSNAIIYGSTDFKSTTHQDSMLIKMNLDTLTLYGDSDTECTTNNNCFGSEDANSDTKPDGISIINMSAGNTDEVISASVNNNGDISFIAKAIDSTKYPLSSYQLNNVGIATAAASSMAAQELVEKLGSATGGVSDGNVHGVILHDVNDASNSIHIISAKQVDNPQGPEIETWITQYNNSGSSDLDNDTNNNDVAIIKDHIGSTTSDFKMLLEPVNDNAVNQFFYGFSQTEHPGVKFGLSINRFDKTSGVIDKTFNGNESTYEWTPDLTNNKSYTLGGQIILSDQTVVTAVLEDVGGTKKIIIIRRNADGTAYTGVDLPSGKVEFAKPGVVTLEKLVYDNASNRLYIIGDDDQYADAGKSQAMVIGINLTNWTTLFHVNIDTMNNDDHNKVLDAELLSDGSLILAGAGQVGSYNQGYVIKLQLDADGNGTDNILGLSGTIGDLEINDAFDANSGDSDRAITLDLTGATGHTIFKQVEVTSDNSLILLASEDVNTTEHLFKYSPNGSLEYSADTSFNDEYEALYAESLALGNIKVRLSKLSSSGLTGEAVVFDMKVIGNNLWFTGMAGFGENEKAFVAKLNATTGNATSTFGRFGLQPGYYVPYARQSCSGVIPSYSNICNISVFTNIHLTSSGRVYVSGVYPSIDNKVDVFIIKFKEAQRDTVTTYTINDGG